MKIRYKSDKQHIVSNVLFKFFNNNIEHKIVVNKVDDELNVLFIVSLIEMNEVFRKRILNNYKTDFNWQRIIDVLNNDDENVAKLSFCKKKNNLIFRFDDVITSDHVYESRRLCISYLIIQNILHQTHDNDYVEYVKCYERILFSYYIRKFSRYFRDYLKHCSKC